MAYEDDEEYNPGGAPGDEPPQGGSAPSGGDEWKRAEEQGPPPAQAQDEWQRAEEQGPPPADAPKEPEAEGELASGVRAAAHTVLPTIAGAAGFYPGMAAGAAAGTMVAPGPGTLIGGVAGGLISAFGVGTAAALAQEWLLKKFGFDDEAQQAANQKANPVSTAVGAVAGALPTFGVGGGAALAARALSGVIGGSVDLAMTGDPVHAAATGIASTALNKPTALGGAALRAGEQVAERVGLGGPSAAKLSTLLAEKVQENTHAETPTGAAPEGAATKSGDFPPGRPDEAPGVATELHKEDVKTSGTNGPGSQSAAGTATEAPPPVKEGIVSEPQNQPFRDEGNKGGYAKDKVGVNEGGQEPTPLGTISEDVRAALKTAPTEEPKAPAQQAHQEQPPVPPEQHPPAPEVAAAPKKGGEGMLDLIKSLKDEEAARTSKEAAATENPPAGPEINAALQRALDAGAKHSSLMKAGRQQDMPPGGKPPGGGGAPGAAPPGGQPPKSKIAPAEPTTRYKEGEKTTAEKAGETVNRGFDNLTRNQNARWHEFKEAVRSITKDYSTLRGKGGEDVYHAIERGELDKLDPKTREGWDKFKSKFEDKIATAEKELTARGIKPADELGSDNYAHRIRNMPFSLSEWLNRDPTGMMRGMERPDQFKALEFRGAEAPDGHRIVVQDMSPTKYAVWKDGEQHVYTVGQREEGANGFKNGDKLEYNGKQYTVDRGRTAEIEKHARDEKGEPLKYKKNAMLSMYEQYQQAHTALEHNDMVRTFKNDKALDEFRQSAKTPEGQAKLKEGWKELHGEAFKDFEGIVMHPDLAQALRNNYDPGLGMHANGPMNLIRATNQFAVRSIFWNPVPHSFNALVHYLGARGEDWLPVTFKKNSFAIEKIGFDNYNRFIKSLVKGFDDVVNQKDTLIDLNRAGAPLVMSGIERGRAHELTGKLLDVSLKNEPKFWGGAAQKFGLGKAVDAMKAVYDGSARVLWTAGDVMMAARIHENEMKGMTREQAMSDASIHMPDYVLKNKLLGIRGLPSMMADPGVFMFGRYHMKVVDSLAHMAMDALGPNASVEERRKAFGNIGALVFMGAVMYPAADAAVRKLTGNDEASQSRRGPLAPIGGLQEAYAGEKTYATTMSNLLTLSPGVKFITELMLTNRDFAGRNIIEPKSSLINQAGEAAEYTAGSLVSPYKTASESFKQSSTKHSLPATLAEQLADVKVPTDEALSGKQKGEKAREDQEKRREKKPRGLIEEGARYVSDKVSSAFEPAEKPAPKPAPRAPSTLTKPPTNEWVRDKNQGAAR